jgi:hypothetical protein
LTKRTRQDLNLDLTRTRSDANRLS